MKNEAAKLEKNNHAKILTIADQCSEKLRGISDQCQDFDQQWALIEGVLYLLNAIH